MTHQITVNVEPFTPQPGDIIVARVQDRLTHSAIERIGATLKERFPDHQVIVLDKGVSLDAIPAVPLR